MEEESEVNIKQEQTFDKVAELYDVETTFMGDVGFYLELAREHGSPVLELGAGTGRVAIELARSGFDVVGLDISSGMLAMAKEKTKKQPADVQKRLNWIQGDMGDFVLGRLFPLIILPARSFQGLLTRADQETSLRCIAKHLASQGRLTVSLFAPSYERLQTRWVNHMCTIKTESGTLQRSEVVTPDHTNQLIHVERIYDFTDEQGNLKRRIWNFSMRYVWRFEMELLLERAGFEVEALYGDYNQGVFRHDGEMLFVARKP